MMSEIEQLVRDTAESTGALPPALMDEQGPTLTRDAIGSENFYLTGLIGGKEVGKSALVNALVGQPITQTTSFGPGTECVIAYAHESVVEKLKELLDRIVPGKFTIVTHRLSHLVRQVLLDLPDIDSHWQSHIEITRIMLRHMLFPLWVQSVEKYADVQPQQLLARVAEGNATSNFIFCLNKTDQLQSPAVDELRADCSERIGRLLGIDPPKIWMLSAKRPDEFDLPELKKLLSEQRTETSLNDSKKLAVRQQDRSLMSWLDGQDLAGRAERLKRLQEDAEELIREQIGSPLLERSLLGLAEDPANRLALTDEMLAARCNRWPFVNLVHIILTPILAVIRRNVGAVRTASLPDAEALVDAHLQQGGKTLSELLRNVFAQLQQSQPQIGNLYQRRKLWEDQPADYAAAELRTTLTETINRQRAMIRKRLAGRRTVLFAPLRWLLTIGAVLWFPFLQPISQTILSQNLTHSTHDIVLLTVRIFSVNELLQNLTFLGMYFFLLWVILRWDTQRRVTGLLSRFVSNHSELSTTRAVISWLDDLSQPISEAREKAGALAQRAEKVRISAA